MVNMQKLLKQTNSLSVNQLNGQIKIQEIWKAMNIEGYPIQVERQLWTEQGPITRATSTGRLIEQGNSCLSEALEQAPINSDRLYIIEPNKKTGKTICKRVTDINIELQSVPLSP